MVRVNLKLRLKFGHLNWRHKTADHSLVLDVIAQLEHSIFCADGGSLRSSRCLSSDQEGGHAYPGHAARGIAHGHGAGSLAAYIPSKCAISGAEVCYENANVMI